MRSLARTLAAELQPRKIRVNAISPGPIETPIYGRLGMPPEAVQQLAANILQQTPMHRFGTADEVAKVALFLASDDSSYLTGGEIGVDGGLVNSSGEPPYPGNSSERAQSHARSDFAYPRDLWPA